MKKLLTITFLFASFFIAKAQTEQGTAYVGASSDLSFITQSLDGADNNSNQFSVDLSGGYFLVEDILVGAELGYNRNWSDGDHTGLFGIGPFARYYFGYVFAGASFLFQKQNSEFGDTESTVDGSSLNFELGYAAFVSDNVAIEPSVFYGFGMGDLFEDVSRFGVDIGFALYF